MFARWKYIEKARASWVAVVEVDRGQPLGRGGAVGADQAAHLFDQVQQRLALLPGQRLPEQHAEPADVGPQVGVEPGAGEVAGAPRFSSVVTRCPFPGTGRRCPDTAHAIGAADRPRGDVRPSPSDRLARAVRRPAVTQASASSRRAGDRDRDVHDVALDVSRVSDP